MVTVLLVRHADIEIPPRMGNPDPPLTTTGMIRAAELARVAGAAGVKTVFTSPLKRTIQTAAPLAMALGLPLPLPVVPEADEFAAAARAGQYGTVVLVVGHTNTIPELIDALLGIPAEVTVSGFDNLFVVSATATEAHLVHLKYGQPN